jgi:hypothetical protein
MDIHCMNGKMAVIVTRVTPFVLQGDAPLPVVTFATREQLIAAFVNSFTVSYSKGEVS